MSKKAPLSCTWSKKEKDLSYHYDRQKADGAFLHCLMTYGLEGLYRTQKEAYYKTRNFYDKDFDPVAAFRKDLEDRGFDPDTFKITVQRKKVGP